MAPRVCLRKLRCRVGRPDQARAELATAVAMLRETGMMFWVSEAERELAAVEHSPGADRIP